MRTGAIRLEAVIVVIRLLVVSIELRFVRRR